MTEGYSQAKKRTDRKLKINRTSIVDQVCQRIKQDIVEGTWKPGDKLPSEAEFAEAFGVNRLSVRMALQKLNTLGIIETRVGEGSFVRDFSLQPVLSELTVFYEGEDKYRDVQQLRSLLENECLDLAIRSATDEDKQHLKEALDHFNHCLALFNEDIDDPQNLDKMVDADFNFHYQIIQMSHNQLYKDIYYMVQQLVRDHITKLVWTNSHNRKAAGYPPLGDDNQHWEIYQSILNGDYKKGHEETEKMLQLSQYPELSDAQDTQN